MKQSKRSDISKVNISSSERRIKRSTPAGKKLTVIISAILAVCILAGSGIYAWFTSKKDYIQGQIDIGTMEVGIHVYKLAGNELVELDGTDNDAHTGQSSANSEGIITYADWDANSAGVRYIAIENNGTIDVKSYLTLQGILGASMNENSLDYFHFLITAAPELSSSSLNTTAFAGYASSYETGSDRYTAEQIATNSSSFKLTNYTKTSRIGSINRKTVNYYRLDFCCFNLPTQFVPTPTEVAAGEVNDYYAQINASVVIKQMNAPENDDDTSGNNTYVDSAEAFIQAVNAAANNDTIFLTSDIEVNDSITIRQRVNLNLNGHTLTVNGNLAYDTASAGYCSMVITGGSRLYVYGDLIIDMPNARFELFGSGSTTSAYASIVLGYLDSNGNMQGGRFYVNCLRDYNHIEYGYTQTAAQVWTCLNMLATMEVGSETGVMISANSTTGTIKAVNGAHDIAIYNYGEIKQIDLTEMVGSGEGHEQIYILNANKFTSSDEGGDAAVLMPSWAVGHITGSGGNPNYPNVDRAYNARAINAAGAVTDWHVYGASWFFDIDIESGYDPDSGKVIRVSSGEYIVNLVDADDRIEDLLAAYFAGEGAEYAGEASYITKLTVMTYESGAVTQADFDYIRLNLDLTYLNLSNAIMAGGAIPSSAMYGESSLVELVLPISEISIGANAFAGTSIEFLTISNNITSIGQNAFSVAEGKNIYITWDSTVPVDDTVLLGFAMDRTIIFMYEYLLDDFRTNNPAIAYHAYEMYDFFEANTNAFYKILTNTSVQLIYYRGVLNTEGTNTLPIPNTVTYGGVTYDVVTLGEHSYRLSISQAPNASITISLPENVKTVEEGVFYGAKNIQSLSLNNITSIGADAFRNTVIYYSNERPSTFGGMSYLGAYAFGGATLGRTITGVIDENSLAALPSSGTLDLSGAYTPADNALNTLKVWRGTLKLNNLVNISQNVTTSMVLYGSTLDVEGCTRVGSYAFSGRFNAAGINYNTLNARCVKEIGASAFANNRLNVANIGLDAGSYTNQGEVDVDCKYGTYDGSSTNTEGIFSTGCVINTLNIEGWLPRSASASTPYALLGGIYNSPNASSQYSTVNINYAGDTLPDYLFYYQYQSKCTIGQLNLSNNITSIGEFAFIRVVIGNTQLDLSGMTDIGGFAFQNARLNSLTLIDVADGAVIGANCFNGASLGSLTSIDLSNAAAIGNNAFREITGGGITSINVSGVTTIGSYAFYGIKNNEGCTVEIIDITAARSVGSYAFCGLNITEVRLGNTAYSEDEGAFTYGGALFTPVNDNIVLGKLRIEGALPATGSTMLAGNNDYLLTYNSIEIFANCRIPNYCFYVNPGYSNNEKGVRINGFACADGVEVAVGEYAFYGAGFFGNMYYNGVVSVGQNAFRNTVAGPNSYWAFDSLITLDAATAFYQITGGPLTISFMGLHSLTGNRSFASSTAIEKLIFGSQLSSFESAYAISGCTNISSIVFESATAPSLRQDTFASDTYAPPIPASGLDGLLIYVPDVDAYANSSPHWTTLYNDGYLVSLHNAMTSGDGSFTYRIIDDNSLHLASIQSYLGSAVQVEIPSSIDGYTVAELDNGVFTANTITTSVGIPASVVYIDPAAFTGSVITSITVDQANPNYSASDGTLYAKLGSGTALVYYCGAKTDTAFTVPGTVTTIAKEAFRDAVNLKAITMSSVTMIDGTAFGGNCAITTYNINSAQPPVLLSNDVFGVNRIYQVETDDSVHYVKKGDVTINIPTGCFSTYADGINWHPYIQCLAESSALSGSIMPALRYAGFSYTIDDNGLVVITGFAGEGVVEIPAKLANEVGRLVMVCDVTADAFNDAAGITAFAVDADNEYLAADESGVLFSKDGTRLIRYPAASDAVGYEVPDGVTRIDSYAFAGAEKLETVYIPTSAMLNMGEQVFAGCSDRLALYGGAAVNPFTVDIPEAILPDEQGRAEDEDQSADHSRDNGSGEGGDGGDGSARGDNSVREG